MAVRKWSQYRKEVKQEPFYLQVGDKKDPENDIVIDQPDTEVLLDLSELPQNEIRKMLKLLCRDQYDRVYDLVRHQPIEVMNELIGDMLKHFGYNPDVPGGSGVSSS